MDKDKFNEIALIVISITLVVTIMIFVFAFKDGNNCVSNPFIYGAEKVSKDPQGDLLCSCGFLDPKYKPFFFDKNGFFDGLVDYDEEVYYDGEV